MNIQAPIASAAPRLTPYVPGVEDHTIELTRYVTLVEHHCGEHDPRDPASSSNLELAAGLLADQVKAFIKWLDDNAVHLNRRGAA